MNPTRIAELLSPFLEAPLDKGKYSETSSLCHSEKRSDEESAVLSLTQLQSISTYIDILLRWNSRINLTAIRDPEQIVTRHFGESLFAARLLFPTPTGVAAAVVAASDAATAHVAGAHVAMAASAVDPKRSEESTRFGAAGGRAALQGRVADAKRTAALAPGATANDQRPNDQRPNDQRPATNDRVSLADIGSGAGFPGLPIKIWAPHIALTLIESNHKKAAFLGEVTRALTLINVNIQNARAEAVQETFATVTLRAVERFEAILPVAAALTAPKGRLALLIGSAQLDQARQGLPNLLWSEPAEVPLSHSRIVLVGTRPR
jgi:16S rRNA (guanine(527)-N(7))-methyltransferase RsmG